jgi:alanine dehydrogenase
MPGAVGRTSTYALCNVTAPYAVRIATQGLARAAHDDPTIPSAVNIHQRTVTDLAVARTFGLDFHPYVP